MELQDRQSYFRQTSAALFGVGIGLLVAAVDILMGSEVLALCIFGGAWCAALGIIGWALAKTLVK